jgi:pyrimidine operon attenuation protein/uracil phosphoribosyltransferase
MTTASRACLYNTQDLVHVLDNMAIRAASRLSRQHPLVVLGIRRRGAPLADLLSERLQTLCGWPKPQRWDVTLKRYADDLTLLHPETQLTEESRPADFRLTDHALLLVDDVLYTGHSLLRLVAHLSAQRPAEIRTACLVDRGCASLPVHAEVVGLSLQVAPSDIIECHVPPYEAELKIELVQPSKATP